MESLFLTFETTTFLFGVIVQWHFKLVFTFDQVLPMSFSLALVRSIFKNLGPYSASRLQVKRNYIFVKETYTR